MPAPPRAYARVPWPSGEGQGRAQPLNGFPLERRREQPETAPGAEPFAQYEGTVGFVAVADTFGEIIRFSGYPDSIVLTARVAAARVRIRDLTTNAVGEIGVNAGQQIETRLVGRIVEAQEVVAAAGAELSVVGKWRDRKAGGTGG